MRRADVALYRAKNEGRSRACIYDADMDADLRERKQLENDLRSRIAEDRLSVAYQPIMNASGEKMAGVEALCRWNIRTRGDVPPVRFHPDRRAQRADHPARRMGAAQGLYRGKALDGADSRGQRLAAADSAARISSRLIERILSRDRARPARGSSSSSTESDAARQLSTMPKRRCTASSARVRFALDDFGTGYSSLLYLRRFPFDRIKIDRSFVRSIETAADAASIVHAIVSLGRGLGMKVTAEGVENAEQQLFLRAAGVHSMQGYRFGKPRPPRRSPTGCRR
jgi:predicted signal transduction protein with EAL and GGDEF domain